MDSKMKKALFLFALAWLVGVAYAQEELTPLVSDRPGHSWDAEVAPHGKLILDDGFCFEKAADEARTFTLSNVTLRYGLFENMELYVGTEFLLHNEVTTAKPGFSIAPLVVATKIRLYEGSGVLPAIGVLAELRSHHIGTRDMLPSYPAPSAYLLFEHTIGERFFLYYDAGLEWDGETAAPTTYLSLCLGYNITESVGILAESNNYLHSVDGNQYLTELGFFWLVSRRVQLDLEADFDLMNLGNYYAIGCGVSWLIN